MRLREAALALVVLAGCSNADAGERFTIDSRFVGRSLEQTLLVPDNGGDARPLLVLLHGRGGGNESLLYDELLDGLDELGERAPVVLLANGGDHSYYHDREDGRWGAYVLREVIPAAIARSGADPDRVAIGGVSMGGFGAFALARFRRVCAIGSHSGAFWLTGDETPAGAFDDAEDFERNDVLEAAANGAYRDTPAWVDVGTEDPFLAAGRELARRLRAARGDVTFHAWPGDHSAEYWRAHMREYLAFYARRLGRC